MAVLKHFLSLASSSDLDVLGRMAGVSRLSEDCSDLLPPSNENSEDEDSGPPEKSSVFCEASTVLLGRLGALLSPTGWSDMVDVRAAGVGECDPSPRLVGRRGSIELDVSPFLVGRLGMMELDVSPLLVGRLGMTELDVSPLLVGRLGMMELDVSPFLVGRLGMTELDVSPFLVGLLGMTELDVSPLLVGRLGMMIW